MVRARLVEALCERYHCLPSALLREDVSILRDRALVARADGTAPAAKPMQAMDPALLELAGMSRTLDG